MLFAPPRPPVRLARNRPFVIGRSRRCELPVPSGTASRRHAEVRFEDGHFVIRDLGSTNGTTVNGELVENARRLEPGDRIDVGGNPVIFCQVQGGFEEPAPTEDQTQLGGVLRAEPVTAFRGDLAEVPAFAVLQMLEIGRKHGALSLLTPDWKGRVWLVDGAPVHAELEGLEGFEAAVKLARAEQGRFAFEPGEVAPKHTIDANTTQLLLEASCRADEERHEQA